LIGDNKSLIAFHLFYLFHPDCKQCRLSFNICRAAILVSSLHPFSRIKITGAEVPEVIRFKHKTPTFSPIEKRHFAASPKIGI
jgi:hypothetical protein